MKNVNIYYFLFFFVLVLSSCGKEENVNFIGEDSSFQTEVQLTDLSKEDVVTAKVIDTQDDNDFSLAKKELDSAKASMSYFGPFNSPCNGCPSTAVASQFYNCGCAQIVAWVDGLVDLPSCYSFSWDFGPYVLSAQGANTLHPYVCFDNVAIFEATGNSDRQFTYVFLDVEKNGCSRTFRFRIALRSC